jgi:NADP-dependent 3-hydroxy acid dehydrogenase YdfG
MLGATVLGRAKRLRRNSLAGAKNLPVPREERGAFVVTCLPITRAIAFAMEQPEDVGVCDIVIRPIAQN